MDRAYRSSTDGHAHGRRAAVGQAVEADALRVHERQRGQPVQNAAVLRDNDRERAIALTGLALRCTWRNCSSAAIGIVRCEDDEAAVSEPRGESLVGAERVARGVFG